MARTKKIIEEQIVEEQVEPIVEEAVITEEVLPVSPVVKEELTGDYLAGKEYCGKIIVKSYPININGKELVGVLLDDRSTTIYE